MNLCIVPIGVKLLRIVCACLVALPLFAAGQGFAGEPIPVSVLVTDEQNQPVAGATVVVRRGQETVASAVVDATGRAVVRLPSREDYVLSVQKKGYVGSDNPLDVKPDTAGITVGVTVTEVGLSRQEVTVQGAPSTPVSEASTAPNSLYADQAKTTPSRPTTLTGALPLVPGVVRRSDGTLGIAGYSEGHSTLLVNSVDVTDPSTGDFGLSVPIDSVETVSVSEMPYLPQYGSFIAGVVAAETRRGGEKWEYSLNDPLPEFRIRSGHLVGLKTASPRLNLSGPLFSNRLYLSEGAEYLLYKQPVRTLPFPFNETKSTAINSFTQIDAILSPNQTLTGTLHFAPHSVDYAGLDYFDPQAVTPNARYYEWTGTVIDRLSIGGGLVQSTLAVTRVSSGIQPQGPAAMVLTPAGNRGNYFSQQARSAKRLQWIEDWAPHVLHFFGEHRLQIGSVLSRNEDEGCFHGSSVFIKDMSGYPLQKVDFTTGRPFAFSDFAPAFYVHDHWALNSRFAIDGGIRLEEQTITSTSRIAPRGGFAWAPGGDGKTVLRGGIGVFYDSVPLSTYAFNSYPEQIVTSYDSLGLALGPPVHYFNVIDQRPNPGFPLVDRKGRRGNFAPYSVAWNLSLERAVNRSLMVRFKYLQSWAQDMITLQSETFQGRGVLLLSSSGAAQTKEYQVTAKIGADPRRQFFASYVRQQAHGMVSDGSAYLGNYPFPIVRQPVLASLPNEIPNRLLFWGTYALPRKVQLNPHLEHRSGFPFQTTNVLQQYVAASPRSQPRFPSYFSFDLSVSKDIQISKKHAIRLTVPLMNLTNHFNPLEVHSNIADPQYGRFFGNYPRRILLDFDFLD
jgi:Carboxypeptidase regulatory-like domain